MIAGILFIMAGVLIALYPPFLSMIVATIFIFIGCILLIIRHNMKRMDTQRRYESPFMDFFIKF